MKLLDQRATLPGCALRAIALVVFAVSPATRVALAEALPAQLSSAHVSMSDEERLKDAERGLLQALSDTTALPVAVRKVDQRQPKAASRVDQRNPKTEDLAGRSQKSQEISTAAAKASDVVMIEQSKGAVDLLQGTVSALESSNQSLKQQVSSAQARIEQLERQLDESRSQLSIAETEVNRLSSIIDSKTRASLGRYNVAIPPKPAQATQARPVARSVPITPPVDVRPPSADADLQVATISVEKADLRLGPGRNHSALMSLKRGSRLMVEARQGEWYRVFAPNGDRAWISADLVTFGAPAGGLADGSTVRVKGFSANAEEEAFRRVQRTSGVN